METRRVTSADEDPYSIFGCPRNISDASDDACCGGERILHEGWCLKQSRLLLHWRRRWIVLTPTKLLSFRTERGYGGEVPTDQFEVKLFSGARMLDGEEKKHLLAAGNSPLTCLAATPLPCLEPQPQPQPLRQCSLVQIRLTSGRPVLLDVAPDEGGSSAEVAARQFTTAVVNAYCCLRTNLPEYSISGVIHSFEPRGIVSLRDRYALGKLLGEGTFGRVWSARCLQTGRAVAVKRVSLLFVREQVREEVAILREVRHPHVVDLLNYLEDGRSIAYLVMELLPGSAAVPRAAVCPTACSQYLDDCPCVAAGATCTRRWCSATHVVRRAAIVAAAGRATQNAMCEKSCD